MQQVKIFKGVETDVILIVMYETPST